MTFEYLEKKPRLNWADAAKGAGLIWLCNGVQFLSGIALMRARWNYLAPTGFWLAFGLPLTQLAYVIPFAARTSRSRRFGMVVAALLSTLAVLAAILYGMKALGRALR